jgi:trans-2,3-dihydro-3-hydroxyanthranilate isomerase
MKKELQYHVVDVFTKNQLEGNALAVFPDARGLEGALMQRIARELNLSETTFIFPAEDADSAARVRIFTTASEMEFAGHPTIGTAYVMLKAGIVPAGTTRFALHENVGLVRVRVDDGDDPLIWLMTPPIRIEWEFDRKACAAAISLGEDDLLPEIPCELLSAGNPNIYVACKDKAAVDRADVDTVAFRSLIAERNKLACIFVFTPTETGAYSRMFAPEIGVIEDPATGSATGPLAAYMMRHRLVATGGDTTNMISEQGTKMGRRSILHVLIHGPNGEQGIEVGGNVTPVAFATMTLLV